LEAFISIIIAHRGNPLGLWSTIHNLDFELKRADFDYELCIVSNGEPEIHPDTKKMLEFCRRAKKIGFFEHVSDPMTPQMARELAIKNSRGKWFFCADNHIVVCPDFFNQLRLDVEKFDPDILHSTTQYYLADNYCYHYKLKFKNDFWGTAESVLPNPYRAYKCGAAGHGAFLAKRSSWDECGGYHLSSAFKGYAGEEVTTDIGMWMQDRVVMLSPLMIHRHWASSARGYSRHMSDDYLRNLFSCAYIMTGETAENYIYPMLEFLSKCVRPSRKDMVPIYDLMVEAEERSRPFAEWLKQRRKRTFEEQLAYFRANSIPYF
jgi:hypothetical protein